MKIIQAFGEEIHQKLYSRIIIADGIFVKNFNDK
jgi:hypothetical protein